MPLYGEPGQRIAYERYPHPGGGPPLYLVHGFTASAASFAANLEGLRKHFTVVTVELLGHGRSDAPDDPALYGPEAAVRRILGLMDELGDARAMICGHSLGGAVALRCALAAPERFAGLVVINSASAAGTPAWAERTRAGMAELAARVRAEGTAFLRGTRLYPAHSRRLDPRSRELLTEDFERLTPAGLAGTAEGLIPYVNAFERVPELQVPVLVVVGERDRDVMEVLPAFLAQLPHGLGRVIGLPEAGHAANLEAPREFEAAVVDFAREIGVLAPAASAAAEGQTAGGTSRLGVVGGVLVAAGLGLLAASLVVANIDRGGNQEFLAAEPATSPTAGFTPVTAVAGTRTAVAVAPGGASTPGPGTGGSGTPEAGAATAVPSPQATETATPSPTAAPARQPSPTPIPTETPTPTSTPLPTATATPSGPYAAIAGPVQVEVGETATYYDASSPQPLRVTWETFAGTSRDVHGVALSFPAEGCYSITMHGVFADGATRTAVLTVAVGGAACGE